MMQSILTKWLFALLVLLAPCLVQAVVPNWQIVPSESSITFTGTQNNAPASGKFEKFTGEISLDPNNLNASKVRIVIDMNSVSLSYADFTATLLTPDWFNVKLFPQAIFLATHFTKMAENQYQANGTITIRDKTVPVTIIFIAEGLANAKARVTGSTILKRTAFGVGQGEWANTDAVKDDVQVNFTITAIKQ